MWSLRRRISFINIPTCTLFLCGYFGVQNERWTGRKALRGVMARAICKHFGPESGLAEILTHETKKAL